MEDVWRGEAQDLLSQIAQLQEENKQLMTNLSHKDISLSEDEFQKHEGRWGRGGPCGEGYLLQHLLMGCPRGSPVSRGRGLDPSR